MSFNFNNVNSPKELLEFLENNLKYGFVTNAKVFVEPFTDGDMDNYYKLTLGENLIKAGYGVCWDAAEFERLFFEKHNIEHECYYIQAFKSRKEGGPTHTFLLFNDNGRWHWFEYTWARYRGIHKYRTKSEALNDICNKHLQFVSKENNKIELYKYPKATKNFNSFEFVSHCYTGEKISLKIDLKNFKVIVQ